jgi:hypothetical protein
MFMPVMNRNACHFTCRRSANICVHRGNFIDEVYQTTVSTKELFNWDTLMTVFGHWPQQQGHHGHRGHC